VKHPRSFVASYLFILSGVVLINTILQAPLQEGTYNFLTISHPEERILKGKSSWLCSACYAAVRINNVEKII